MNLRSKIINGTINLTIINYLIFFMNFLVQIYLAKMLLPEIFGQISYLLAIISVLSAFGQWGVGSVVAIRNDDSFLSTIFTMKLIFSLVILGISLSYSSTISQGNNLKIIFILMSLALCIQNISEVSRLVLQIHIEFSKIGLIRIINRGTAITCSLILAVLGLDIWSLGALYGIEMLLEIVFYFVSPFKPKLNLQPKNILWFFNYAKNILIINFMGTLENRYDDLVVGRIAGVQALGLYNLGWKISRLFNTTTIATFSSVIVPSLVRVAGSRIKFSDSYNFLIRNVARLLGLVYGLIFLIAPFLIENFMGTEWIPAAYIMRFGIVYSFLLPLYTINRETFYALSRPDIHRNIQIILFVMILILVPIGALMMSGVGSVVALSIAYSIGTFFSFKHLMGLIEIKFSSLLISVVSTILAVFMALIISQLVWVQILLYIVIYTMILLVTSYQTLKDDFKSVTYNLFWKLKK